MGIRLSACTALFAAASAMFWPMPKSGSFFSARSSGSAGTSVNWSGYAADGSQVTEIHGSWKIPAVKPSKSLTIDAAWVGIGGANSADLIQSGTQGVSQDGKVSYQAWIEMLPAGSQALGVTVHGGDTVSVAISQRSAKRWQVSFVDQSTGATAHREVDYSSSLSSAEWIEEAPSDGDGVMPLDSFGSVAFADGGATMGGKTVSIAKSGAKAITMTDASGAAIAIPSALNRDGNGFSVRRAAIRDVPTSPKRMFDHLDGWTRPGTGLKRRKN